MKARYLLFVLFLLGYSQTSQATHIFAAQMEYQCLGNSTYAVKVYFYTECGGVTLPNTISLEANSEGCKQSNINYTLEVDNSLSGEMVTPLCSNFENQAVCNGGGLPSEQLIVYVDTIQLPFECPDWKISVSPNVRSSYFTNLVNPASGNLYIESLIDNSFGACYHSPAYRNVPMLYACAGEVFSQDMGAFDWVGDTIVYHLVAPKENENSSVSFQAGLSANQPLSIANATTFELNNYTGQLTFTPQSGQSQVAAFSIRADKYHQGKIVASTIRDVNIQSSTFCTNASLNIAAPSSNGIAKYNDTLKAIIGCVADSSSVTATIYDSNGDAVFVDTNRTNLDTIFGVNNWSISIDTIRIDSIELTAGVDFEAIATLPSSIVKPIAKISFTDKNCPFESRRSLQFVKFEPFIKTYASQQVICANSPQVIQLDASGTAPLQDIEWFWPTINGIPMVVSNPTIKNPTVSLPALAAGTRLEYAIRANLGNQSCDSNVIAFVYIEVVAAPTVTAQIVPVNQTAATAGSITTTVTGNLAEFEYSWNTGEATAHLSNLPIGDYELTVTDYYGCQTQDTLTVTTGSSVRQLDATAGLDWQVAPNPTQSKQLYIQTIDKATTYNKAFATTVNFSVFNHLGQLVYQQIKPWSESYQFSLQHLPSGNYWLKISTKQGYVTKKISIQ